MSTESSNTSTPTLSRRELALMEMDNEDFNPFSSPTPNGTAIDQAAGLTTPFNFDNTTQTATGQNFLGPASLGSEEERAIWTASVLTYLAQLQDGLVRTQAAPSNISNELKKDCRSYAFYMINSPALVSYRGNIAENTVKAMRDIGIPGVPREEETAKCVTLQQLISGHLTNDRHNIKAKVLESMKPTSKNKNIAKLCRAIAGKQNLTINVEFYMRIAFVRWAADTMEDSVSEEDWWKEVDKSLVLIRKYKSQIDVLQKLNQIFQKDKNKYGDPANSGLSTTVTMAQQTIVDKWAGQVKPPVSDSPKLHQSIKIKLKHSIEFKEKMKIPMGNPLTCLQ
ncbi:hypothetical protein K435DRAFT_790107 [Dendrothele bispora CBS 962.96]|uniref:Uncharacterized protein n=1 Tax=Dendrothele bispora (strain CBS 962.96) TaxID=1314807 RepID=A0A4S8MT88_DENBC|nr:hypothetical protein K435DRAFT_790107 [Dendrothele bispora CBS 962.96]